MPILVVRGSGKPVLQQESRAKPTALELSSKWSSQFYLACACAQKNDGAGGQGHVRTRQERQARQERQEWVGLLACEEGSLARTANYFQGSVHARWMMHAQRAAARAAGDKLISFSLARARRRLICSELACLRILFGEAVAAAAAAIVGVS